MQRERIRGVILTPETIDPTCTTMRYSINPAILAKHEVGDLPRGIGIIGGAARVIAWEELFDERRATVRDVDLIGLAEFNPDEALYEGLSRRYMPDDHSYGFGLQTIDTETYFKTRDFTVNEVAVIDGELLLTEQAYDDLRTKTIRFSKYESTQEGGISDKLYKKAELMECVFQEQFREGRFVDKHLLPYYSRPYNEALALNKAFQYGERVTARFLKLEADLPERDNDAFFEYVRDITRELSRRTGFEFRGSELANDINNCEWP